MTMAAGVCRDLRDRLFDRCFRLFPCLSNPEMLPLFVAARRSSLCLKVALVILHLIYAGALFLIDRDLIDTTKKQPWYTALYVLLFVATLIQYFITSASSPGYVVDAMRDFNERDSLIRAASAASKQPATSKNGGVVIDVDENQLRTSLLGSDTSSWTELVMELYPPVSGSGTSFRQWTCTYCNVLQPPRAKHCHDCDKCVLQFDHHCVWLGTDSIVSLDRHFVYFIPEEQYIKILVDGCNNDSVAHHFVNFHDISSPFTYFSQVNYIVLTNQTTYELVRRRRIGYMRGIPERVYPFSEGICRNVYNFCCDWRRGHRLERLPTAHELQHKATPYACSDVLCCRCC
ncbi:hypothetical protein V2J09_009880 [Rumex salicifolius]